MEYDGEYGFPQARWFGQDVYSFQADSEGLTWEILLAWRFCLLGDFVGLEILLAWRISCLGRFAQITQPRPDSRGA